MSSADETAVLAVIEALRDYRVRRGGGRSFATLAEEWRDAQLFPPTAEQMAAALRLIGKTDASG